MGSAAIVALASVCAIEAQAQETTGDIRGQVTSPTGAPVAGANVTVIHTPSNTATTATTDASGGFGSRGLRVGGPYTILVQGSGFAPAQLDGVTVNLGSTSQVNIALTSGDVRAGAETIVITASAANTANLAIGPSVSFSLADLQNSPSVNRDLKDIVRMDPRIYLDESFGDSIQCAGAHPRFNQLTVDGVTLSDGFGLNSNGYPTERMPFPFDAISQVSVELAPFDVQYGSFTACNINAVTKSGDNEFHGGIFYDFTNDSLRGDSIEGQDVFVAPYEEKRYGATLGGPIIPDRLFFFAAYEKFEGVNQFFRGPAGSGAVNEIAGLSQANYDEIVRIANEVYGYDPGPTPLPSPAEDEKYLVRLDWNITQDHRASFTYNFNEGLNRTESDGNQATQFEFEKHLYSRGASPLKAYAAQLFSDWTNNFSTELRFGYNDVNFVQQCVDGGNVGEVQVRLNAGTTTVYLGCDDSRHANQLDYTVFTGKLAGTYLWNDHALTAGFESQTTDIFNMFVQHTEGEYVFGTNTMTNDQVLDAFEAGQAAQIFYGNGRATNDPADASATFGYTTNTVYAQDEWTPASDLTMTLGLRYDWYTSEDKPGLNQGFLDRNGFNNQFNLDGIGLLQPRLGITYDAADNVTLRAGLGLYSGGNPNVWVSNSYSNDGIANIQVSQGTSPVPPNILTTPNVNDERGAGQTVNPNGALWGVPEALFDMVANAGTNNTITTVNAIDPDFEVPAEWKFNLGATVDFDAGLLGEGYRLNLDFLRSQSEQAAIIQDIRLEQVGTAPDGRPIYRRIDRSDPDCIANPGTAATANPACTLRPTAANDLVLANSDGGYQNVFSVSLEKSYDFGVDWSLAYAHVTSTDVSSMTSSVAFSNWTSNAVSDINNPGLATSNYEIPHRLTGSVSWSHAFFGDYMTRATLFGQHFQNRPFSFVFAGASGDGMFGDGQQGIHLVYIPLEGDPNVTYGPNFDLNSFNNWIDLYDLERGAIAGRNDSEGQWASKIDLRLEQEFPTGYGRGAGFIVFENLGNMINDDWGVWYQSAFPQRTPTVTATLNPATNRYTYTAFNTNAAHNPESRVGDTSFWTVRLGLKYEF